MNKPIEIIINGRFLTQRTTGVQRIAEEFVKTLDVLIDEKWVDSDRYHFTLLSPRRVEHDIPLRQIRHRKAGRLTGHIWEQLELLWLSRGKMLLSLCGPSPVLKFNQIVLLPDANVFANPSFYTRLYGMWHRFIIPILGKVACRVITISNFSKSELTKYAGIDPGKINVIYLGVDQIMNTQPDDGIIKRHGLDGVKYVLAVSSHNPNKNFHTLAKALECLRDHGFQCVVAGGHNSRVFGELKRSEGVTYLGYVSDGELKSLYSRAACFVYPSFYEGFGLPPVEAMACGCPVIVSNSSSLPEICDGAALYCDPFSAENMAITIHKLVTDQELQTSLRAKGLEQAAKYSWKHFVMETITTINAI